MQTRAEILELASAVGGEAFGNAICLQEKELVQLETILGGHPEVWPIGMADTFKLLQRKLRWESVDRQIIPEPLLDFFDEKFRRDLDPMALARSIGQDLCSSCSECECRC